MFVEERQREILEFLHQNGKVLVKDLSERYQVTPDL
ncbi:MAG: DeoR family transcriptional regulator, partial [Flexilinea sp.]|nr:DeoR family transcriptional regulator [Flexilinea sp.]